MTVLPNGASEEFEPNAEPLLKVEDVAVYLRVSADAVYALVRAGQLPAVRLGRRVRVYPRTFFKWLECGGTSCAPE